MSADSDDLRDFLINGEYNPPVYLSFVEGKWAVMVHGVPLCVPQATRAGAIRVATQAHLACDNLPVWDGELGRFWSDEERRAEGVIH